MYHLQSLPDTLKVYIFRYISYGVKFDLFIYTVIYTFNISIILIKECNLCKSVYFQQKDDIVDAGRRRNNCGRRRKRYEMKAVHERW